MTYNLVSFFFLYGFPLLMIVFCYARILCKMYRVNSQTRNGKLNSSFYLNKITFMENTSLNGYLFANFAMSTLFQPRETFILCELLCGCKSSSFLSFFRRRAWWIKPWGTWSSKNSNFEDVSCYRNNFFLLLDSIQCYVILVSEVVEHFMQWMNEWMKGFILKLCKCDFRYWFDKDSALEVDQRIQKALFMFACTNSCANPVIYGMFHFRPRENFHNLKVHFSRRRRPVSDNPDGI